MPRWKLVAAFSTGLAFTLAFPIWPLRPLAWVALAPLYVALQGEPAGRRFLLGWVAGLFVIGLHWLVGTMHVYGYMPLWLSLIGHVLFTGFLASFTGLFGVVAGFTGLGRAWGVFGVAAAWVALEYLRAYLFTGFPWFTVGYTQMGFPPLVQILDLTGIYGMSFLLTATGALVGRLWIARREAQPLPRAPAAVVVGLLVATVVYGQVRIRATPDEGESLTVTLLQGNIPQDVKWNPEFQEQTVETYVALARSTRGSEPDLVVLPETAMPFWFQRGDGLTRRALDLAKQTGAEVVLGAPAFRTIRGPDGAATYENLNRAYHLRPTGEVASHYDKLHLVPFGEYSPFPFLEKVVEGIGNFHAGTERVLFETLGGVTLGTLICYEVIFPAEARATVNSGAELLVNITNDAWFGKLGAPVQHLEMTQARALENRIWTVRAANTGITAIIDPWGRVIDATALFEERALVGDVRAGPVMASPYRAIGDVFAGTLSAFVVACVALAGIRRRAAARDGETNETGDDHGQHG